MFYLFDQNNSHGYFVVNENLCHRLYIEADSGDEAIKIAESLGCYWNGVSKGIDCPCCGDRWSMCYDEINLSKWRENGYSVSVFDGIYKDTVGKWWEKYGKYNIVEHPHLETTKTGSYSFYVGSISFGTLEEYAQYLADEYGFTEPDGRIFYKNGDITEIHSNG